MVQKYLGVFKAYTTRVGNGPFPTEQDNAIGEYLRERGHEYGTTTGRPRRCGWFDAVAVRYSASLCGIDSASMMLLDVLSGMDEVKICTAYEYDGRRLDRMPGDADVLRQCQPVYETLAGWAEEVQEARCLDDLPAAARRYIDRISEVLGIPISIVSVGPDRTQTIFCGTEVYR